MIGTIIFNGNIIDEREFIYQFKDRILQSSHIDPSVRNSKKVLLITSAWHDNEYNELHIKEALKDIGIQPNYKNGFDENIQNLSAYHEWQEFLNRNPGIKEVYISSLDTVSRIKSFYRERNYELIKLLQLYTKRLKQDFPSLSLAEVFSHSIQKTEWNTPKIENSEIFKHYSCKGIAEILNFLISGDEDQAKMSEEMIQYAKINSGLLSNFEYHSKRKELIDRILSSNSIFIFGGSVVSLFNSLKFWELEGALSEALMRGSNFYTVSAGSIILCKKIITYSEFIKNDIKIKHFDFFDNGCSIVTKIKLFPHCRDRVQTDDPDNLSYLAHRFEGRICVGLNEESFLLLDTQKSASGKIYPRFTSVGKKDGVYVFEPSGKKTRLDYGEQIIVPGTLIWEEQNKKIQKDTTQTKTYQGESFWA